MTIAEAIEQFLQYVEIEKGYSRLTVQSYRRYLVRFAEWVAESTKASSVGDINVDLVRDYRLNLARATGPDGRELEESHPGILPDRVEGSAEVSVGAAGHGGDGGGQDRAAEGRCAERVLPETRRDGPADGRCPTCPRSPASGTGRCWRCCSAPG